jgi:nitric oxide reductase NorQ protein
LAIANRLGRPVSFMAGNDWLEAEDMIGKVVGQATSSVVDKYIQRVRRSESHVRYDWEHSILAEAMEKGQTLVYDEFTRSSAKANGILLSVLEEGVLISTNQINERTNLQAHPDFRIILTSNPHDYAGVNATPDALLDRMVTFNLNTYSIDTKIGIVAARTGLTAEMSGRIVRLVHDLQGQTQSASICSMRGAILIARIAAQRLRATTLSDALLAQIVADVMNGRGLNLTPGQIAKLLAAKTKGAAQ